MKLKYLIKQTDISKEIKEILKENLLISNRLLGKIKNNNKILLNKLPVKLSTKPLPGDIITINLNLETFNEKIIPENISLDILFEDDNLIIINKQPNIVVHPTYGHHSGTIANALMYHFHKQKKLYKIRPVSRLDKNTSGIIVFAKNEYIQECLIKQMKSNKFKKEYLGIVTGTIEKSNFTINQPIARKTDSIILREVAPNGSPSITHCHIIKIYQNSTLLKFILETGRTHQIRVHCSYIGHPLIGDKLYNTQNCNLISRQALHSYCVEFYHPITSEVLKLKAPIPQDIKILLKKII